MSVFDAIGLVGVVLMLGAYGAAMMGRLPPQRAPALVLNGVGAALVLVSLTRAFNLSAALVEGAWALIALAGLVRIGLRRNALRRERPERRERP